jgi:hypothetical protein
LAEVVVVVAEVPGELPPAGAPVFSPADELAGTEGLVSGCGVGLAGAELADVLVGVADVRIIGDFDGVFVAAGVQELSAA